MPALRATLLNAAGFQVVWFSAVIGAAQGVAWAGPLAACVFCALVLGLGGRAREDLGVLAVALPLGFVMDTLWVRLGWLSFASPSPEGFAPFWILAMWAGFALTINHSLSRLRDMPWAAVALGAIGGPLAYAAAARGFGAASFTGDSTWALAGIGLGWAMAMPLLYLAPRRLRPAPQAQAAG